MAQLTVAVLDVNRPAEHTAHADAPVLLLNMPLAQSWQLREAGVGL